MTASKGVKWYRSIKENNFYWFEKAKTCFAIKVEKLMEYRGVKQKDLAQKLEQSPASISKVLRGDANLTIETMVKLVRALDAELEINIKPTGSPERPWLFDVNGGQAVARKRNARKAESGEKWKNLVEKGENFDVAVSF